MLFIGIVRLELMDNLDIFSEDPRETGDIDLFNPELIPLQRDSYLGQFLVRSQPFWVFKVVSFFINLMVNEMLKVRCASQK